MILTFGSTWLSILHYNVPDKFICPFTLKWMHDSVMTRWGHNFERKALMQWMAWNNHCSMTRKHLTLKDVIGNQALRSKSKRGRQNEELEQSHDANGRVSHSSLHEIYIIDRTIPFLVHVSSKTLMAKVLQHHRNDSTDKSVVKELKRRHKGEKSGRRRRRAA